jgi:hypothetical protein
MIQYSEQFNKFWHLYPTDLAQGKPGSKFKAYQAWEKYSDEEQERIIFDTEALIRHDRRDSKPDRWPHASTYLNQRYFERPIGTVSDTVRVVLDTCHCGQEVIGPKYSVCAKHLEDHAQRLKMMNILKEIGCAKPGQSLQELSQSCREYLQASAKSGNFANVIKDLKNL